MVLSAPGTGKRRKKHRTGDAPIVTIDLQSPVALGTVTMTKAADTRDWRRLGRSAWRNFLGTGCEHPVDGGEMAPRVSQHFAVGGVIGILDGDDAAAQLRVLVAQVVRELLLGLRGPDDENFMDALQRVRDIVEVMPIRGRLVAAVRALAAVDSLVLIMRVDHRARLLGRGELPDGRPLMIDPDD